MTRNECVQQPWVVRKFGVFQAGAVIVLFFLGSVAAHAQQLTQLWANTVDGPAHSTDQAAAIVADSNDNSYVTGKVCVSTTS